jgi:hypothetical protein
MTAGFRLTPRFKARVRRIVEQAFKINFASNQAIKRLFPKCDLRKALHWGRLIEVCIEKLEQAEEPSKTDQLQDAITAHNCYYGRIDTFLGVSARVQINKAFLGTAGWCDIKQSWTASIGSHGRNQLFKSADAAVSFLVLSTII